MNSARPDEGLALDLGDWFEERKTEVRANFARYFGGHGDDLFTGRHFEHYSAMGNPDRFEPSDLLAIEALSVRLPEEAAAQLFIEKVSYFSELLADIPANIDIWNVPRSVMEDSSAAAKLHTRLREDLDGVDWVKAGKLLASKRPRLVPILDDYVKSVVKPPKGRFWVSLYDQLLDENRRNTIAEVCECAPEHVSFLRRIDVAIWMHVWVQRHGERLFFKRGGCAATGYKTSGDKLLVRTGSKGRAEMSPSARPGIGEQREDLQAQAVIAVDEQELVFLKDHLFRSPSEAGRVLIGSETNGKAHWRNAKGECINDLE